MPRANDSAADRQRYSTEWRRGVVAMMPLWTGVAPFGLTLGVVARQAGFDQFEVQLSSIVIFAGSAQLAMVSLYEDGAAFVVIILTAAVLNLSHILYGLSLRRYLPEGQAHPPTALLAFFLTDEAYGVTVNDAQRSDQDGSPGPRRTDAFLWGASLSLFVVYTLATFAGVTLGAFLPDAGSIGLDLVFPLSFLALLIPLLRTQPRIGVALLASGLALAFSRFGGGVAVLGATLIGAAVGAAIDGRTAPRKARP